MLAALALAAASACGAPAPTAPAAAPVIACPAGVTAPDDTAVEFRHATNVSVTAGEGYRVLTVNQPFPGGAAARTVLLPCGAPAPTLPPELADAPTLTTPVTSLYSSSTTQLPMLVEIGALDALTGVGAPDFVTAPEVRLRIDDGRVSGFAADGTVNTEAVVTADPDVLLSQGTDDPSFAALRAAGIPVIGWAEYLDTGPLAQAEWIKAMGALTGRDAEAERVFTDIERRYTQIADQVRGLAPTPVLLGQLYQGTWTVPAGGSTSGTLVRDAGGTWSEAGNTDTGSVAKDFETVFAADGAAAIWIADGPFPTLADVTASDARYATLAAVISGQVWSKDKATTATGGNDLYERGVTHPDEQLADLAKILHPDVVAPTDLMYTRQVTG